MIFLLSVAVSFLLLTLIIHKSITIELNDNEWNVGVDVIWIPIVALRPIVGFLLSLIVIFIFKEINPDAPINYKE